MLPMRYDLTRRPESLRPGPPLSDRSALAGYAIRPRRCSSRLTARGLNAAFSAGSPSYGLQAPHMKMSIAAKSRSGHVWMEMWLSASTSTPLTPPFGEKWWKCPCKIVAPAASAASRSARSICVRIAKVGCAPQIDQQMHAGELHAILLDEIILLDFRAWTSTTVRSASDCIWLLLGSSETIPSGLSAFIAYPFLPVDGLLDVRAKTRPLSPGAKGAEHDD